MESGWCPVFAFSDVESKLSVLGAVSKVDVDFAAVRFAVDKDIGVSGRERVVVSCSHVQGCMTCCPFC